MNYAGLYNARVAKYYDVLLPGLFKDAAREAGVVKRLLAPRARRVLDAACGTGRLSFPLARLGLEVVGVDASRAMLGIARKRKTRNPNFVLADLTKYRPKKLFDGVVCANSTLCHPLTRNAVMAWLRAFHSVLRPGGRLVFDVWQFSSWGSGYVDRFAVKRRGLRAGVVETGKNDFRKKVFTWTHRAEIVDKGRRRLFRYGGKLKIRSRGEWKKLLRLAGFKKVRVFSGLRPHAAPVDYFVAEK
jgi:SAM-dependent methyltransferase